MNASILDKIRQLRALSQSSNINEACAAAAAADKLISKYRITEVELNIANEKADLPAKDDPFVLYETGRIIQWKHGLARAITDHYGCVMWNDIVYAGNHDRKVSRFRLVGTESDMEIVRYMFAWLTLEIEGLCKSHCVGMGHVYAQSYCQGAVNGIKQQFDQLKKEEKVAAAMSGQTTALACLDERVGKATIALYTLHKNLKTYTSYSHARHDNGAYKLGVDVGKSIHLGKVMGGANQNKMLK